MCVCVCGSPSAPPATSSIPRALGSWGAGGPQEDEAAWFVSRVGDGRDLGRVKGSRSVSELFPKREGLHLLPHPKTGVDGRAFRWSMVGARRLAELQVHRPG